MKIGVLRWDGGIAVGSEYDGGFLTVQPDLYGEEKSGGSGGIVQHPYGFLGRPADPDEEGACQALYAYEGDEMHVLPTQDARVIKKLPELKKGGSIQYGRTGTFDVIDGTNGSKLVYAPYAFDDSGVPSKAMAINIDLAAEALHIAHGDGMAIVMADGKTTIRSNDGTSGIILDGSNVTIFGNLKLAGGLVAGSPATAEPLVTAPALASYLAALEAWMRAAPALGATIGALPPSAPAAVLYTSPMASVGKPGPGP